MSVPKQERKDTASGRRPSLEQKIRQLVRNYRVAERRCPKRKSDGKKTPRPSRGTHLFGVLVLNLFPVALLAAATSVRPNFEEALQASATGQYDQAAKTYRRILADEGDSAAVLYNLGNAFYHQGRWGRAILNYERALWLAPHDHDVTTNLRLARSQAGLPVAVESRWEKAGRWTNADTAAWIGCAALGLTALVLLLRRLLGIGARSLCRTVMLCSCAVAFLALADVGYWWTQLDRAVILSPGTSARIAPASAAATLFG